MGERGIYDVSNDEWSMIYQGANFKGIDIYHGMIYFLQGDASDSNTSIMRMDYNGENVEVLLDNSGLLAWSRIYDDILYSYEKGTFLIKGYKLDKEGRIEETLDNTDEEFLYRLENEETLTGVISSVQPTVNRGFSLEYYDGIFETRKIEDSSEILSQEMFFISKGKEELIVPDFHDNLAIIGAKVYYTKGNLMDSDVYMMDLNEKEESKLSDGNLAFINYDKEYLYFTDEALVLRANQATMVKSINLNTKEIKELFPIEIGVVTYENCFDILDGWAYYKDTGTGGFVRRSIENTELVQTEPSIYH